MVAQKLVAGSDFSPAGEKEFIEQEKDSPLEADQTRYLIGNEWFDRWSKYISKQSDEPPGSIDNSDLLSNDDELREQIEETDFVSITKDGWTYLCQSYGLIHPKMAIDRRVIETGAFFKTTKLELMPPQFSLSHYKKSGGDAELITKRCSHSVTLADLKSVMRDRFGIAADAETKLVTSDMVTGYQELRSSNQSLSDLNLHSRDLIVIVEKDGDKWPDLSLYRPKESSDYPSNTTTILKNSSSKDDLTNDSYFAATTTHSGNTSSRYTATTPHKSSNSSQSPKSKSAFTTNSTSYLKSSSSSYFNGFSPGTDYVGPADSPGLCGLSNLGNTCFMNSALQCLSNVPVLTEFFTSDSWKAEVNRENSHGMQGKIAEEYSKLMKTIWDGKKSRHEPTSFYRMFGQFAKRFSGFQQQDMQELLMYLLDGLHEDLKRANEINGFPSIAGRDEWEKYKRKNDSIVTDLFHGMNTLTITCPLCHTQTTSYDPFSCLSLPIPSRQMSLTIHFVSSNPLANPIKCQVKVAADATVGNLCASVANMFDVLKDNLVLAEVSQRSMVDNVLNSHMSMQAINTLSDLFIFQVDKLQENIPVSVSFKYGNPDKRAIAWPRILMVPDPVSFEGLYHILLNYCQRFMDGNGLTADGMSMQTDSNHLFEISKISHTGIVEKLSSHDTFILDRFTDLCVEFSELTAQSTISITKGYDVTVDDFMSDIHIHHSDITLEDCLQLYATGDQLGAHDSWSCPNCRQAVEVPKHYLLYKLPQYLIVHLKRYTATDKLDTLVKCPLKDLDMSRWVDRTKGGQKCVYDLIAVSNHYGGLGGGHYTAYVKHQKLGKWYEFNDEWVTPHQRIDDLVTKDAYLLIYERK